MEESEHEKEKFPFDEGWSDKLGKLLIIIMCN